MEIPTYNLKAISVNGLRLRGKALHEWLLKNDAYYVEYLQQLEKYNAEIAKRRKENNGLTNKKISVKLNIERFYYTVNELAEYWQVSIDDIMQLGITDRLKFSAIVKDEYPEKGIIKQGEIAPMTLNTLNKVYCFNETVTVESLVITNSDSRIELGDKHITTYYPDIDNFIIPAIEVERFENEYQAFNNQDDIKTDNKIESKVKAKKKLKPLIRNTSESLTLIYEITTTNDVEYEQDLTAHNAWGLIISEKFKSDLIKTIPKNNHDILVLNSGETLNKNDFVRKYRDRFK